MDSAHDGKKPDRKDNYWKQAAKLVLSLKWVRWVKDACWLGTYWLAWEVSQLEGVDDVVVMLAGGVGG